MKVRVYRDVDTLRLRKVVLVITTEDGVVLAKGRMFYLLPFYAWRLQKRLSIMMRFVKTTENVVKNFMVV